MRKNSQMLFANVRCVVFAQAYHLWRRFISDVGIFGPVGGA